MAYLDDLEGLGNGSLGIEGKAGIDLGGDLAGDDLENLGTELNEKTVKSQLDLVVGRTALGLGVGNGLVDQSDVLGLLGSGQDERGVGRGILGLVLADGCS